MTSIQSLLYRSSRPLTRSLAVKPAPSASRARHTFTPWRLLSTDAGIHLPPPAAQSESRTSTSKLASSSPSKGVPIGRVDRRLQITFTCTAAVHPHGDGDACGHRSTHEFSARSYEKGIVLIECPGCKNRHLIADNLSWFSETPSPAFPRGLPSSQRKSRTVEDLVKEKGEKVKWVDGGSQGATWELEGPAE